MAKKQSAKPVFSEVVVAWRDARGMSNEDLGRLIGVSRQALDNYINENIWGKACIPALTTRLGLEQRTWEEVDADFTVTKWKGTKKSLKMPQGFSASLTAIDAEHETMGASVERLGILTRNIFNFTGERHFLVSCSSALVLMILNPDSKIGQEQRRNRFVGLDNGLLWALISPELKYLKNLNERYGIDLTKMYARFVSGFDGLFAEYVEHLRPRHGADAERIAHTRMQRFEWDDFPLTSLDWTVSLLGVLRRDDTTQLRAIVRAPYRHKFSYQILPTGLLNFETHLLSYFTRIIEHHRDAFRKSKDAKQDGPVKWKLEFCNALLQRMTNEGGTG